MALTFVVDKSALARLKHTTVAARLAPLLVSGELASCGVVELELLYSARSHTDFLAARAEHAALPRLPITESDFARATDVLASLSRTGQHRAVGIPDLLIAAVAERHHVGVIHYDKDFDLIARVTGQAVEWVVPAGSVS